MKKAQTPWKRGQSWETVEKKPGPRSGSKSESVWGSSRSSAASKHPRQQGGQRKWRSEEAPPTSAPVNARINLKEHVSKIHKETRSEGAFFDALRKTNQAHHIPMTTLYIHAMRVICEHDDLRLCERLLQRLRESEKEMIINSRMGGHEYTPLCRAAYRGSDRMVRLLIASEADVNFVNVHGENLDNVLDQGERTAIENMPDEKIFIQERYSQCRGFIHERRRWLIEKEERERAAQESPVQRWVPPAQRQSAARQSVFGQASE